MEYPFTSPIEPAPQEVSPSTADVVIEQSNAITLAEGLLMARRMGVPLGRSTLQRWAKVWSKTPDGPVKCVLLVARTGRHYELDCEDLACWLQDELENQQTSSSVARPNEVSSGLGGPAETLQESSGSHEAPGDAGGSDEASQGFNGAQVEALQSRVAELEDENMQLKIDVGVRHALVSNTKEQLDQLRGSIEQLLKENGALDFQLRQLQAPDQDRAINAPHVDVGDVDNHEGEGAVML